MKRTWIPITAETARSEQKQTQCCSYLLTWPDVWSAAPASACSSQATGAPEHGSQSLWPLGCPSLDKHKQKEEVRLLETQTMVHAIWMKNNNVNLICVLYTDCFSPMRYTFLNILLQKYDHTGWILHRFAWDPMNYSKCKWDWWQAFCFLFVFCPFREFSLSFSAKLSCKRSAELQHPKATLTDIICLSWSELHVMFC